MDFIQATLVQEWDGSEWIWVARKRLKNIGNSSKQVRKGWNFVFWVFPYRKQEKYYDEEEAFIKHKKWEIERNENEVAKLAFENERRQWILKKQEHEKMQVHQRLEKSKKRLACAQANLQKVLENEKNHKPKSSTKVRFILRFFVFILKVLLGN